jgi:25S rRNA (uracil2634-N3)-methyltransferase
VQALSGPKLRPLPKCHLVSTRRLPPTAGWNASQLARIGAKVLNGIGATRLQTHFGATKFRAIIFNFPNVPSRTPIYGHNPNHVLVRNFLRSAAGQLVRGGIVVMTVVDSAFYAGAFGLPAAARFAGFGEPEIHNFKPSRFPGYLHANTLGGQSALMNYRAFSTWVFRL